MSHKQHSRLWDLAKQRLAAKDMSGAKAVLFEIVQQDHMHARAWNELGLVAIGEQDLALAFDMIANAVKAEPNNFLFHRNLGEVSRRLGRYQQAILSGKAACELAPNDRDSHYNLGLAYSDQEDFDRAASCYRKAARIDPKQANTWNNLGVVLEKKEDLAGALKAYEKAIQIDPTHAQAHNNLGVICHKQHRFDRAREAFESALTSQPDFIEAHHNLCELKTYRRGEPQIDSLKQLFDQRNRLEPAARVKCGFALGKALEDTGEFDASFVAYADANSTQFMLSPFDEAEFEAQCHSIMATYSKDIQDTKDTFAGALVRATPVVRGRFKTPVFIVGMPHSGARLLEQMLDTLPEFYGGGELSDLHDLVAQRVSAIDEGCFSSVMARFTDADIKAIASNYLNRVCKLSPQSQFVSDSTPANFIYLGLIYQALSNAKVIHVSRDPMDACFSCYARLFDATMAFTYDQGTLGRYYRRYRQLMQHWSDVLPADFILDVQYEDMVKDPETQARRVLDFLGIDWNPVCLDFHKSDRVVKTASVMQVRQPVYSTSIARWKPYAAHLRPLYELVKEYRDPAHEPVCWDGLEVKMQSEPRGTPHVAPHVAPHVMAAWVSLFQQCVDHQTKGEHEAVVRLLGSKLEEVGPYRDCAELWHTYGISCYRLDQFDTARQSYERALQINPKIAEVHNTYGFLLKDMGLHHEAQAAFEQALVLDPANACATLNLGMVQLTLGDFASGWDNYEARWTGSAESLLDVLKPGQYPIPQWQGETDTRDRCLLVIAEQGFGDTFQFSRYLPELSTRFKRVAFVCSAPTARLMEWSYSEHVVLLTHLPVDYSQWDWQVPLMSVPRALKTRLETIPNATPYLRVPKPAQHHWRDRLQKASAHKLKVGIAWAGRQSHQYDARRSLALAQLTPVLLTPNVTWVSLQKWGSPESLPTSVSQLDWLDWTTELMDFADTAALVANLDLVISVDSAMVHLAASLDKPVWMLNRFDADWRWLKSRVDSPWYPSLRLFNQPQFGDWLPVIDAVAAELGQIVVSETKQTPQ
jgi:tetratricopeptide (TPR) repeat protein